MRTTNHNSSTTRRLPRWSGGLLPLILAAGVQALPAYAQDSEVLTKIEVQGSLKQTSETVMFKAGVKEGDDLRNLNLTEVLDRLWATGAYDDIKFEVTDVPEGKKLIIRVVERPIVKEVDFRGGSEVGLSSLKDKVKEKKLTINPDTLYDPETARKVKALIVEEAADKGFRNPVIDVSLEPMSPGVVRLVFDIKEGGKVKIYKIAFRGNKVLTSSQLHWAMKKTRQHWMFSWLTSHDKLVDKTLEDDLENIKKAYWRLGYKDVFVGQPTVDIVDKTTARQKKKNKERELTGKSPKYKLRASLTIPVLEGERYYEGTFKVEGNDKVMKGQTGENYYRMRIAEARRDNNSMIAKFLNIKANSSPLPPGKLRPFDLDALNTGIGKIKEEYSNMAYVAFRADKKLDVREENGVKKVDVTVKVDEGEMFTIRRIDFQGNDTTKDKVLRRALMVKEGDPFRMEMFKDSFTRLSQLGFFDVKDQEPKIEPVGDKPQVDITVKGEEAGVNEIMFQGGFGSVFGLTLGATFSTHNLGGGGETLGLSYQGGKYQTTFGINYTEPYIKDLPYSLYVSLSNSLTDYDASRVGLEYAYKERMKSVGTGLGTSLSTYFPDQSWAFFTSVGLGYSFRLIDITGGHSYVLRDSYHNLLTSSVNASIGYSTINHPYKPSSGMKLAFSTEYGGWQMGTDRPFYRASWVFTKFANIADRHIFGMNLSYGYIRNLSDQTMAIYDLYRPGGENSVRGYQYGQIGSVVYDNVGQVVAIGGNKQFLANFEYQIKIADPFRIVLFYDAGNAWGPGNKVFNRDPVYYPDPNNPNGKPLSIDNPLLLRSAGIEIRFFLPVSPAPMRLIWAKKQNPYPWDTYGKTDFQFSIGTTF